MSNLPVITEGETSGLKLIKAKRCNQCDLTFTYLPKGAVLLSGLYWVNCKCETTITLETAEVIETAEG